MLAWCGVLAAAAFALCALFTPLVRALGRRLLLLDSQGAAGHVKPVLRRVPNIGGVAVVQALALPALAALAGAWWAPWPAPDDAASSLIRQAALLAPEVRARTPLLLGILGCVLVLHAMGVIDDRRALRAAPKLLVILGCALAAAWALDVRLLTALDARAGGAWASIALTVLWIGVVTNAMNFIDNMDGLCAGVGAIGAAFIGAIAAVTSQWLVAGGAALLAGALAGFLLFNFPRRGGATIFLGDGGSLVVGFMLAILTVRLTYYAEPAADGPRALAGAWHAVFTPLCLLAVPLYDFASVCLIRVAQGKSIFVGDQQHFSHRLRARGLSVRRTWMVICGCAAATGISGLLLANLPGGLAALAGVQTLLILLVLALYEHGSARDGTGGEA